MDTLTLALRRRLDAALLATDDDAAARLHALIVHDPDVAARLPEVAAMNLGSHLDGRRMKDLADHVARVTVKVAPTLRLRLAAFLHDVGKPPTAAVIGGEVTFRQHEDVGARIAVKVLRRLGYDDRLVDEVATLVGMSGRFKNSDEFSDAAARRFASDAGPLLADLLEFAAADNTSRHERKRLAQQVQVSRLAAHIDAVAAKDAAAAVRPDLDGNRIQQLLGVGPGPLVGKAYRMLLDHKRRHGPLPREQAEALLLDWAAAQ